MSDKKKRKRQAEDEKKTNNNNKKREKVSKDIIKEDGEQGLVAKTFNFYHQGSMKQQVKVWPNTPVVDVIQTVFTLFHIMPPRDSNNENLIRNMVFLDEDGTPVVFSPNHIPSGRSFHIHFNCKVEHSLSASTPTTVQHDEGGGGGGARPPSGGGAPPSAYNNNNSIGQLSQPSTRNFKWDAEWNRRQCGYELSSDDTIISMSREVPLPGTSMPILISDRCFEAGSGVYSWRVVWGDQYPYHSAGIVSADEIRNAPLHDFGSNFKAVPWFYKVHDFGPENQKFVLDMNKRTLTANDIVYANIPDKVYAAICFKHNGLNTLEGHLLFDVVN